MHNERRFHPAPIIPMSQSSSDGLNYRKAGVDIDAGNALVERIRPAVERTRRPEVLGGLGGFGGLFRLGGDWRDPVLVSGTDGVGTKLMLAHALDHHRGVGIDLVAMCVNDILVTGAEPLFFLDYYACGRLDVELAAEVVDGIAEGCEQAGCALIGGETAEMPGMYGGGDYDLAGFAVGAVERNEVLDGSRIAVGDVLLGLDASGPHSNGFSLIRAVLERAGGIEANRDTALALLEPTRIYVRAVRPLIRRHDVRGIAHITGGGLAENVIRVVPDGLAIEIDTASWRWPETFEWLAEAGGIATAEMRRTFNLGIGMVLIVPAAESSGAIDALAAADCGARAIGRVVAAETGRPRVRFLDA